MSAAPLFITSPVIERTAHALLLTLAMTVLLAPAGGTGWLTAGLGLLLAAWPLLLAERALGLRARKPLLTGMQVLTREADAVRGWRVLAWSSLGASLLALTLMSLLAGLLATQAVQTVAVGRIELPAGVQLWPVLTVVALLTALLRPLGKAPVLAWTLPVALLLGVLLLEVQRGAVTPLQTDILRLGALPPEAMLLVGVLALGGGLGVHWQLAAQDEPRLSARALLLTLAVALVVLAGLHVAAGLLATLLSFVVTLLAMTALVQPALAVARARGLTPVMALALIFVPVVLLGETIWFFGGMDVLPELGCALALWMTLNLLVLAVFAGWVMKISHVRKALQLPSEGVYNLWRVAVRWVAPITLLLAAARLLQVLAV